MQTKVNKQLENKYEQYRHTYNKANKQTNKQTNRQTREKGFLKFPSNGIVSTDAKKVVKQSDESSLKSLEDSYYDLNDNQSLQKFAMTGRH